MAGEAASRPARVVRHRARPLPTTRKGEPLFKPTARIVLALAVAAAALATVGAGSPSASDRASYIVVLKDSVANPAAVSQEHAARFGGSVTHTQFGGRAVKGVDEVTPGGSASDCNGHGTHVSGTVGGSTYGVAKAVRLVAVRVLNCSGSGSTSGVIAGIDWVTGNHLAGQSAVANMSLGGGASSSLDTAVNNSINDGVSYAIAAGNGDVFGNAQNACNFSPARVAAAMTISATDRTDTKASWANYGSCVDWFAPGVSITSAWYSSDTATNTISGTSMATPHTTGVAALYLQGHPGASPSTVRTALYNLTTKSIVKSSNTTNNHLLFTNF